MSNSFSGMWIKLHYTNPESWGLIFITLCDWSRQGPVLGWGSFKPRFSVPDFVSQLWRKINFSPKLQDKIRNRKPGFEAKGEGYNWVQSTNSFLFFLFFIFYYYFIIVVAVLLFLLLSDLINLSLVSWPGLIVLANIWDDPEWTSLYMVSSMGKCGQTDYVLSSVC